jgi:hypothetical protein
MAERGSASGGIVGQVGAHCRQLCAASRDRTGPARTLNRRSAPSTWEPWASDPIRAGAAPAGGADPAIGAPGICGVP